MGLEARPLRLPLFPHASAMRQRSRRLLRCSAGTSGKPGRLAAHVAEGGATLEASLRAARLTAEEITFSSVCALNLDFKETLLLPMSLVAQPWFLG